MLLRMSRVLVHSIPASYQSRAPSQATERQYGRAGVATAIGAMAAPAWEIRNSASLAFTALLMRTVGFKNVTKVRLHASSSISWMAIRSVRPLKCANAT